MLAATVVPVATTQVNLSSAFNRMGIVADGTTFSGGGLDGDGYALSSSLVGPTLTAGGTTFNLGPAGANDVVSAAGQTIALPSGNASELKLLATGVNGSQANQTFTVTYTDGTTATFIQSISDWAIPQGYAGESDRADDRLPRYVQRDGANRHGTSTNTPSRWTRPSQSRASPCPMTPTSRCWRSTCWRDRPHRRTDRRSGR